MRKVLSEMISEISLIWYIVDSRVCFSFIFFKLKKLFFNYFEILL